MKDKLGNVLDWLKSKDVDYADCRFVRGESESIRVTNGIVDTLSKNINVGVGVRVLHNGAWGVCRDSIHQRSRYQKGGQ